MPRLMPSITPKNTIVVAASTLALAVGAAATVHALNLDTLVTIDVDGQTTQVRTSADTVADVLDSQGVDVTESMSVSPASAAQLDGTDVIKVRYAKPLDLVVDGRKRNEIVHDVTVGEALETLNVRVRPGAAVSTDLEAPLETDGNTVTVSNPKKVGIIADGKRTVIRTTAPTVSDVLDEQGVDLGTLDEVRPRLDRHVRPRTWVKVTRIEKVKRTRNLPIDYKVKVEEDDSMYSGEKKVVRQGRPGAQKVELEYVLADGKVRERKVVSRSAVRKPVHQVEKRGTKKPKPASSGGSNDVNGGVWDKIAKCESGGNWSINTGNGYYGGLQFSLPTWRSVGGPGYPHEHPKSVQIKYAKILQARSGWGQWSCAAKVGIR